MTNTQKEYIALIARWYYLSPIQIKLFTKKELKTIQNQLLTMYKNGLVKRLLQPYTNEYVYTPTYKGYRLANLSHYREKKINLYTFNHTQAIINYVVAHDLKDYETERELIRKLYLDGKPNSKRTPDLSVKGVAYEFELTFKSKARYIKIQDYIDNQLNNKIYKKWVWVVSENFKDKLKEILLSHTLEDSKLFKFEILPDPNQISIFE